MEEDRLIRAIKWSILYIISYGAFTILGNYLFPDEVIVIGGLGGAVYIIINAFFIKYKRERLFLNGLISAFGVLCLGIMFGKNLPLEGIIMIGVYISFIDILSFTKYGKHTLNAKAMSNVNFTSKLIVYGKEKGDILVPTCGIGDYFYYAMWISGIHNVSDSLWAYVASAVMILVGSCVHYGIIAKIYKKESYKGFPATVFPFLCVAIIYGFLYFVK